MTIEALSLPDVKRIVPRVFTDARGFFLQLHHEQEYREAGIDIRFVQDNGSRSVRGTLRGLHYQLHTPQAKLMSVIRGTVFDVAVDIRRGSPTFGRWVGETLSDDNHHQLYIPAGFAHGFCVLSAEADILYKCGALYAPDDEYAVRWDDPDLAIDWPATDFQLSDKDRSAPRLADVPPEHLPRFDGTAGR